MAALKTSTSKRLARAAKAFLRGLGFASLFLAMFSPRAIAQSPAPPASTEVTPEINLEGRTVAEVRVVDDSSQIVKQPAVLALKEGAPFEFAAERESLRQLYATGDYAAVRVTADTSAAALRVNFIVTRDYYNNVIRIFGLKE